jgi:hypothetical protein
VRLIKICVLVKLRRMPSGFPSVWKVVKNQGMSSYGTTMLVSSWYESVTGGGSAVLRCLILLCSC